MRVIKKWLSTFLLMSVVTLTLNLVLLSCSSLYADETASTTVDSTKRQWNLNGVDIHTLINEVAKVTGKNFVVSPQVIGKVTFISSHQLTSDELYQAFLALLETNGFAAVANGSIVKIVPVTYIKEEGTPVIKSNQVHASLNMAATVVRVKYVPAAELVKTLRQLVYHFGYIEAYTPTNDVIISDHANNVARIIELIHSLDKPTATSFEAIRLKHAQATDLVNILSSMLKQTGGESELTIAADDRGNDILLHGGTPEQRLQVRSLVAKLDVKLAKKTNTEVIYLKYLRAEKMAVIVNGLIENALREKNIRSFFSPAQQSSNQLETAVNGAQESYTELVNRATGLTPNPTQTSGPTTNKATADFSNMAQKQPKSGSVSSYVQWEESTNSLIVTAPNDVMVKIKSVIARLDIRRPQVLIEAIIAEVEASRASELGIELNAGQQVQLLTRFFSDSPVSTIGANNQFAITNPATANAVGLGLSSAYSTGDKIRFLIRALENDSRSNILSTPNILTLDNEPAQIKVGQLISFSIGQVDNSTQGGTPFSLFNQQDVGLTLTINPQITPDHSIKLIIQQELSSVLPGQVSAGNNPNLSQRFIHTTVMAKNGDILVLGGLIQNEWQDSVSKVPFLGDLPAVGVFFRSQKKNLVKTNLMIFLRPTILYNDKDTFRIVGSKYEDLRQKQLESDYPIEVSNKMTPPVLPPWNGNANLPPPFEEV